MKCDICKDKRYIFNSGKNVWDPCKCLFAQHEKETFARARIDPRLFNQSWDDLSAMEPGLKVKKRELQLYVESVETTVWSGPFGPSAGDLVWSLPPIWMDWVIARLTKAHLKSGRSSYWVALDEMVNFFLQSDKAWFNAFRNCPVLILRFGQEYTQQIHQYVIKHLLEIRADPKLYHTLWVTPLTKGDVTEKYSSDIRAGLELRGKWI